MTPERQAAGRLDTIDLLRGFSVLGVVLLHCSLWLSFGDIHVGQGLPKWLRYVIFSQGGNGVSVFFAISGFLITWTSIRRFGSLHQLSPARFYRIRFARIAPPLLLLLLVVSVLHLAHVPDFVIRPKVGTLPRVLFAALTFQLNWYEAVHGWLPAVWTVLWSLSVEEVFYLAFPVACVLLLRMRWTRPIYPLFLLALVVFGPFARQSWYSSNDIWLYQSYWGNVDNIALGCLFAMLAERLLPQAAFCRSRWPLLLQALGAVTMLFVVVWDWPKVILGFRVKHWIGHTGTDVTLLGLGACLVMLGSVLRPRPGSRWSAPVRWFGRLSYEVYLAHEFAVIGVLQLFFRFHGRGLMAIWIAAVVVLSGVLGWLLERFVSAPANRRLRGAPLPAELRAHAGGSSRRMQPAVQ